MKPYVFKSEADELSAFVGEASGHGAPGQFAPWRPGGAIETAAPPHNFSRYTNESVIKLRGYQLWWLEREMA